MANNLELITRYLPDALDKIYVAESKSAILRGGKKLTNVQFVGANRVKVPKMLIDGLGDYSRVNNGPTSGDYSHYQNGEADGYKVGSVDISWEEFALRYDRGRQFQIDTMDMEETANLLGQTLPEFMRTKVVPETDAIAFSTIATRCNTALGNYVSETIADNTIMKNIYNAFAWFEEHEVPDEEQIIFVNPSVMKLIRNTTELYKRLDQVDYRNGDITFTIKTFEGRPIIVVPQSRFMTEIITNGNGYQPTENSKIINYMVVARNAVLPIVKLNTFKIFDPQVVQDFDGYKANFRIYHDVIIPDNKVIGAYISVSEENSTDYVNTLSLTTVAGPTTNGFIVKNYWSTPTGLWGKLVRSQTAFTLGKHTPVSGTVLETALDTEIVDATNTTAYFALLDSEENVIATTTEAIPLNKKSG